MKNKSRTGTWTAGALPKSLTETLMVMCNVTSSLASEVGLSPSLLQDGPMTDLFGQALAPAKASAQQAREKAEKTNGISGRHGLTSSASENLQSYLENRLQAQLPLDGGMRLPMIWKMKRTPARRRYCQLAVSAHHTKGIDSGLWATPNTMDYLPLRSKEAMNRQFSTTRKGRTKPSNLREQVIPEMWPTPRARDYHREGQGQHFPSLARYVETMLPTPQARDFRSGSVKNWERHKGSRNLNDKIALEGNGGLLNPAWVAWLMGYPIEWENCADMVTPLSRKSRRNSSKQQCEGAA